MIIARSFQFFAFKNSIDMKVLEHVIFVDIYVSIYLGIELLVMGYAFVQL